MFILHSSNKTENLLVHLTTVIKSMSLSDPFAKEVFLIQSQGMERWLSQQLATEFGVWCNYDFLFPGKFFSTIAGKIDQRLNDGLFDRDIMLWRFELLLRQLDGDCFKPLRHYLQGDNKELKRFQLAEQFSQVFDQYQMMRPDMLNRWQKGQLLYDNDTEIWQRELWKKITQLAGNKHRGSLWEEVITTLNQKPEGTFSQQLPERLFVFGVNTMPPLFLSYLQGLSRHCDVHLFLLNPAQVYWADIVSKKQFDEQSEGHPLLATLAQQGREFQQMLLEQVVFSYEPSSFEPMEITNNLQQLQSDILDNQLQGVKLVNDHSISLHACHSRRREIDVLKDQLLLALEQDPKLELRDIVVMAPDIQQYAPFISALFDDIQHAVADKSLRLSNTLLDVFIRFLKLSQGRFGWQGVIDLLEQSSVYTQFSLVESEVALIKHWVVDTRVRWGKSATHKKELGLPELNENTWQTMLERLLMGYAVGDGDSFVDGVLPYHEIEGSSAQVLGSLNDFIQLLFKASTELKRSCSVKQWSGRLSFFADKLLSTKSQSEQSDRQQLNELLGELAELSDVHDEDISLDVIVAWLEGRVCERKSSTGFLRGQLTFCSMLPMRSIPFKVIALLGLNEGEFPKVDRPVSFDLIGQNFRLGDRSRRADDRYQFLEILLSARQQLIVTYIGQSIKNNESISPSVVINELLDVLTNYYQLTNIVNNHPLQAFSSQYFIDEGDFFSFSHANYQTAVALQQSKIDREPWWEGALKTAVPEVIDINDLFAFFRQPQHYFFRQLGIRFDGLTRESEERESFTINTLDQYGIDQQWIDSQLKGDDFSLSKLQAQGRWLAGMPGELAFEKQEQVIDKFVDLVKQQELGEKIPDQALDIHLGDYHLVGNLQNLYEKGSLIYRYAKTKGKDFMAAWLHHLLINQHQAQDTHLVSSNDIRVFSQTLANSNDLMQLIELYLQGREQPNAFFTESAFCYIKQVSTLKMKTRNKKLPIVAAQERLDKDISYDRHLQQLYQNVDDLTELLNQDFEDYCNDLLLPIWEAAKKA